jgi:hypothetical protein
MRMTALLFLEGVAEPIKASAEGTSPEAVAAEVARGLGA